VGVVSLNIPNKEAPIETECTTVPGVLMRVIVDGQQQQATGKSSVINEQ
jgi:hypothetical protein